MKLIDEYKQSLKAPNAEEFLDRYFWRWISLIFVKLIKKTRITPNHLTIGSLVTGMASGVFFAIGTHLSIFLAGLLYAFAYLFDLSDGQLARLSKKNSEIGKILDHVTDQFVHITVYIGFSILFIRFSHLSKFGVGLVIISFLSLVFHAFLLDLYRTRYLAYHFDKKNIPITKNELLNLKTNFKNLEIKGFFTKVFLWVFIRFMLVQIKLFGTKEDQFEKKFDRADFLKKNRIIIRFWTLFGTAFDITLLIVAAFLKRLDFYFYGLIIMNVYHIFIVLSQVLIDKKTKKLKK